MKINWPITEVRIGRTVGRIRCERDWRLDAAWSARQRDFDLWLIWAGRGRMWIDGGRPFGLHPGVCLWMRPGHDYRAQHDPDDRLGVTFIHFDLFDRRGRRRRLKDAQLPPLVSEVSDLAFYDSAGRRVVDMVRASRERDNADALASGTALLRALLMGYDRSTERREQPASASVPPHTLRMIHKFASMIRENPADAPQVAELARRLDLSPDHFARLFRRATGQNPSTFMIAARLERARLLLTETELSIARIAELLGYRDIYFFSRQFRAKVGIPPSEFRAARG